MSYVLTMVTLNRAAILKQSLDAIIATTRREAETDGVQILVTDNASTDDTPNLLRQMETEGKLKAWIAPENLGTEYGRNVFWHECMGHDVIRIDDKVKPLYPGWLTTFKRQSQERHSLVAVPYDPTVQFLWNVAPPLDYVRWDVDQGQGGPLIYIPAEAVKMLGACDEIPGLVYGWGDCLYLERARLLGWQFGFSLRVPVEFLAQASPQARARAMEFHGLYLERLREYREAERDVFVEPTETRGYKVGLEARS